ncbi:tyrosine-protein phosphatase [Pontibacillus yanchengensis]|uniref:Tyrosine-protein phosphatase n=1 Tax=Pontibacillus yanchengensis Y32 TaxID=1385514 RepID=A0A0A2TFD5_9BACI|nr:CpsB/CapC family capsule biosynthesis tyrosine phosphatase [Pontibacillus yanchengensis]KGP74557.1 tyrosine protein phosphatase [Pontibacillus yanchengensis Y32]
MIDVHSHILPNMDDGPQNVEESKNMAKAAMNDGIHTIIATPHHQNGTYLTYPDSIRKSVSNLNQVLEEANVPITILPGQETRINGDMVTDLQQGNILPLNETSGYVFVELPSDHVPRYTGQMLFDIQVAGYKPIIVHPERNSELIQHPDQLYIFVKNGTFTQVTAASVCGKFGKKIRKFSHQLIEANLTHLISSDAHNTSTRNFCMREAYEEIEREYGISAKYTFSENAELLVEGKVLAMDVPERIKKRKILGLF